MESLLNMLQSLGLVAACWELLATPSLAGFSGWGERQ